jgi:S-(hydroxymethyl)glutathione synthase
VKVAVKGTVLHNHACGCSKCWKPKGAAFSIVAVAAHENVSVLENGDKLHVVDPEALIQRHACKQCGVHMYGPVERDHAFKGLDFVHPERFQESGWPEPGFAAFVSSIIETGTPPSAMAGVRGKFREIGLETYDCLNPTLMDVIATWVAKKAGTLKEA